MKQFLSVGNWGDMFAALGNIEAHPSASGFVNVIHYGPDPDIEHFIAAQTNVFAVRHEAARSDYREVVSALCDRPMTGERYRNALRRATPSDVAIHDVIPTHVNVEYRQQPVNRWGGATIPAFIPAQLKRFGPRLAQRAATLRFLLNPFSLATTPLAQHWPHWELAVRWLLRETPHEFVIVGRTDVVGDARLGWVAAAAGERVINLVNQTRSMLEVLALAQSCDGIITTSNSLSMWTVMQGIPGLIALNRVMDDPEYYFRRWIEEARNTIVGHRSDLRQFQGAFVGFGMAAHRRAVEQRGGNNE